MAKYDYYAMENSNGYLLDVQADLLDDLSTTIVVPLIPLTQAHAPIRRLNPVFDIGSERHLMDTQYMAAVSRSLLKHRKGSVAQEFEKVTAALDMLFQGY